MSEWKETTLCEICSDISYGYTTSATKEAVGPKFLRITDIVPNTINWQTVPFCIADKKIINKYKLKDGDIVIARTGATTGYNKVIKNMPHDTVYASYLIRYQINEKKAYPYYIGYILQSLSWYDYVDAISGGSAQPGANAKQLSSFSMLLPPLSEQKAIAGVLSSLDEKIDLLHRQNKTLESFAETLFRHFFIDNAQDDWEEVDLGNLVSIIDNRGKTPPNQKELTPYPLIEINVLGKDSRLVDYSSIKKYVDKNTFQNWFRGKPYKYDILISTVGSIGELSMYLVEKGNIAQNVIALHANNFSPFYIYQILKYKLDEIFQLDIGGVQPSIKVPHLLSIIIPIPDGRMVKIFDEQLIIYSKKMENNYFQIQTLKKLRDALLHKLISGDVCVEYKEVI